MWMMSKVYKAIIVNRKLKALSYVLRIEYKLSNVKNHVHKNKIPLINHKHHTRGLLIAKSILIIRIQIILNLKECC